jgi:hypothetical protein
VSRVEEISRALNCRAGWRIEDLDVRRRSEIARRGVAIVNVVLLKAELMMFLDFSSFPGFRKPLFLANPFPTTPRQVQDNT